MTTTCLIGVEEAASTDPCERTSATEAAAITATIGRSRAKRTIESCGRARAAHAVHLLADPLLVVAVGPECVPRADGQDAGEDDVEQKPRGPVTLRVEVEVQHDQRSEHGGGHGEGAAPRDPCGRADA